MTKAINQIVLILIGVVIGVISCFAIIKGGSSGIAVAGSAVSGLCVYVSQKPRKRNGSNNEPPTT